MNVREDLFLENHLMVASGQGKAKLNPNGQIWSSKFDTNSLLYGFSLRGLIETSSLNLANFTKEKIEIWPSISFDQAVSKAKNLRSSFEFGSLNENLEVDGSKVKVTEISLASEFKFQPKWGDMLSYSHTLSVAPGYFCQWISSSLNNNSCGSDIHVALVRDADGRKLFNFQFQNLTNSKTFSASLIIVVPFSNLAKSSRSHSSAPIDERGITASKRWNK